MLRTAIEPLPYRVRDDVLSYATFVEEIAEERAARLDIRLTPEQRDQVVFLTGVMYVRDMVGGHSRSPMPRRAAEQAMRRTSMFAGSVSAPRTWYAGVRTSSASGGSGTS